MILLFSDLFLNNLILGSAQISATAATAATPHGVAASPFPSSISVQQELKPQNTVPAGFVSPCFIIHLRVFFLSGEEGHQQARELRDGPRRFLTGSEAPKMLNLVVEEKKNSAEDAVDLE